MANDRKNVAWYEGMTLDPHHFQQWDRYHAYALNIRMQTVSRFGWGLLDYDIDRERLANGQFALLKCTGVFPEGLLFDIPATDEAPAARNFDEAFPAALDRFGVFLSIPARSGSGGNCILPGSPAHRETRFSTASVAVPDENAGSEERHIDLLSPNFQIRFADEKIEAYSTIKITEIRRSAAGTFELNDEFIPTVLSVAADDRLRTMARRLLELLVARSASLDDRRKGASNQRELTAPDIMALTLLNSVNTYIPLVNHIYSSAESHPEVLYTCMLSLAGQLAAQVSDARVHPKDFPPYEHGNLSRCFNELDTILREMLGVAAPPSNYIRIPLRKERDNLLVGDMDGTVLEHAQIFLVARGDGMPEDRMITEVPRMLRVASPDTIDAVLRSYTRALAIEHTTRLPSGVPMDNRANYFQVQKWGPFWEAIEKTGGIAIYIPSEFNFMDIELVAVDKK